MIELSHGSGLPALDVDGASKWNKTQPCAIRIQTRHNFLWPLLSTRLTISEHRRRNLTLTDFLHAHFAYVMMIVKSINRWFFELMKRSQHVSLVQIHIESKFLLRVYGAHWRNYRNYRQYFSLAACHSTKFQQLEVFCTTCYINLITSPYLSKKYG